MAVAKSKKRPMGRLMLTVAFVAFISLGLPDGLLGVAWPSMSISFGVELSALSFALVAGTGGYVVSTVFSGKLVAWLGIGRLLALSSTLTACALIGYTLVPAFWLLLALVVIAGFGGGAIDAGINIYIAQKHRQMLYWLHAMFGVGTTLGPFIMTTGLNISTWRLGYLLVGIFQLGLAAVFLATANMWQMRDPDAIDIDSSDTEEQPALHETLRLPAVWLSIFLFVLYAGLEISVGQWTFSIFTEGRGISSDTAGFFVGAYWGSFTLGRALGTFIVVRILERRYISMSMAAAIVGAVLIWWNPIPIIGLLGLPIVGFAFAPIFPALVGTTEKRVGRRHMANTIGFQIGAAGMGMAFIPSLAGAAVAFSSVEAVTLVHLAGILLLWAVYERVEPA